MKFHSKISLLFLSLILSLSHDWVGILRHCKLSVKQLPLKIPVCNCSCLPSLPIATPSYPFNEYIYLLLTEFEGRTVSYGPSFFLLDLWPKREARGP